mmetsp:Transcript_17615/g.48351  ORF Transcript_17615/g.48351 Transcript_17615/m.48351 type:complete len:222 (-) Transcript_17615:871-1536(-)
MGRTFGVFQFWKCKPAECTYRTSTISKSSHVRPAQLLLIRIKPLQKLPLGGAPAAFRRSHARLVVRFDQPHAIVLAQGKVEAETPPRLPTAGFLGGAAAAASAAARPGRNDRLGHRTFERWQNACGPRVGSSLRFDVSLKVRRRPKPLERPQASGMLRQVGDVGGDWLGVSREGARSKLDVTKLVEPDCCVFAPSNEHPMPYVVFEGSRTVVWRVDCASIT